MSNEEKKSYDIGRGKPPREHQFKKGQSGNPRGRPKRSRNLSSRIVAAAQQKVIATSENGRKTEMTKLDVALAQVFNKAAKGDLASIKFALSVVERAQAVLDAQAPGVDPAERRERDRKLIEAFRKQIIGKKHDEDGGE